MPLTAETLRRHALLLCVLGVSAVKRQPMLAASNRKMYTWLSCSTIGVQAKQWETIDLAQRYGFQAVEPLTEELAAMTDDELRRLVDAMTSKGLKWGTATMRLGFHADEPEFAAGLKQFPAIAKALRQAGVTRIYKAVLPASDSLTYSKNFKRHVRHIAAVATVLEDHGLRLGLEYSGPKTTWSSQRFPFVHTMAETKELIAAAGKKNVGFDLDTFHWYTAHETVADLLTLTNHDIVSVDACDAPAGIPIDQQIRDRRELPCATGTIPLDSFMNALIQIGYDGPVRPDPLWHGKKWNKEEALSTASKAMQRLFALIR